MRDRIEAWRDDNRLRNTSRMCGKFREIKERHQKEDLKVYQDTDDKVETIGRNNTLPDLFELKLSDKAKSILLFLLKENLTQFGKITRLENNQLFFSMWHAVDMSKGAEIVKELTGSLTRILIKANAEGMREEILSRYDWWIRISSLLFDPLEELKVKKGNLLMGIGIVCCNLDDLLAETIDSSALCATHGPKHERFIKRIDVIMTWNDGNQIVL